MTPTPFADAAKQSVALARDAFRERNSQDPVQQIRERMSVQVNAAILIGTGEMLDRGCGSGDVSHAAIDVLASGLASILLTMASGNAAVAMSLIEIFARRIARRTESYVSDAPDIAIIGTAVPQQPAGQA